MENSSGCERWRLPDTKRAVVNGMVACEDLLEMIYVDKRLKKTMEDRLRREIESENAIRGVS